MPNSHYKKNMLGRKYSYLSTGKYKAGRGVSGRRKLR